MILKLFTLIKNMDLNENIKVYIKNEIIAIGKVRDVDYLLKPYEYKDVKRIQFKKGKTIIDI